MQMEVYRHSGTDEKADCLGIASAPHLVRQQQDERNYDAIDEDAPDALQGQRAAGGLVRFGLFPRSIGSLPRSLVCSHLARMIKLRPVPPPEALGVSVDAD